MSLAFQLHHRFPSVMMDMAFEVPSPGITVLFGPSGSGKSTVIAAAAGLMRPDQCYISIDGKVLVDTAAGVWLPPEKRRVGLVFQDARLFPHMSVLTNLRFGMRRAARGPVHLEEVVDLLGIGALLDRLPKTLSGGERQRVAIGRALLAQPSLLLMDEPLASLDDPRKVEIMPFLLRLKTALNLPVLYVTHATDEVARLADSVVMLEACRVIATGTLPDIVAQSDLPFGRRDDAGAILLCHVAGHDTARALTRVEGAGVALLVPMLDFAPGTSCRVRIPAREVILARDAPQAISMQNILNGTVRKLLFDRVRHVVMVEIALPGGALLSRITPDAVERLSLAPGAAVLALIKSTSIEILALEPAG